MPTLSRYPLGAHPLAEKLNPHPGLASIQALVTVPASIPAKVDYSGLFSGRPARDQGSADTCVGFASAALKEAQDAALFGRTPVISPLWIYNRAKAVEGGNGGGIYVATAFQVLQTVGAALESDYPYAAAHAGDPVPAPVRVTPEYRISSLVVHYGLSDLKTALATFGPAVMVIAATNTLFSPFPGGIVNVDPGNLTVYGYHAVLALGYDDATGLITFRNSWGDSWGDSGCGHLSYAFFERFGQDCTTAVDDLSDKIVGDENGDGKVNIYDAQIALMAATGSRPLTDPLRRIFDVNGDGKVDVRDALAVMKKMDFLL